MDFNDQEIFNIFRQESAELIQSIDNSLLVLQKDKSNDEEIILLSRSVHSLKGALRMLGFSNIQKLVHKFEDVIIAIKDREILPVQNDISTMANILNYISYIIQKTLEDKNEFYDENLENNIKELENIIQSNSEVNSNKNINYDYTLKTIEAIFLETFLFYKKYKETGDKDFLEEIDIKIQNIKESFEVIDYKEGLFEIQKVTSHNKKEGFEDALLSLEKVINQICEKHDVPLINAKEEIENQLNKNNKKEETETKKEQVEVKQINLNMDNKYSVSIKKLVEKIAQKNIVYLKDSEDILNEIIQKSNNPIIKNILQISLKIVKNIVYSGKIDNGIYQALYWALTDLSDMYENIGTTDKDWEILLQRIKTVEQMLDFTPKVELTKQDDVKEVRKSDEKQGFKGIDWFNNIAQTSIKTLRVDSSKLDKLVNQASELILTKIKITEQMTLIKKLQTDLEDFHKNWHKVGDYIKYYDKKYLLNDTNTLDIKSVISYNRQLINFYNSYSEQISLMSEDIVKLQKRMQDNDVKLSDVSADIESMTKNLRILPLATIFHLFPRMVHNISQERGKDIELVIEGGDVSCDKKIIEEIKLPLIHILRNCIDHGIESKEEREVHRKSQNGTILIRARHHENKIIISIKDDGRGIDLERIKQTAISKGFATLEDIKKMSNEQILDLIFSIGFTTRENVTDLSGRGLGLDIVRSKIAQLNGKINVVSETYKGTTFTIELPVQMATTNAFIIQEQSQFFAIDTNSIQAVVKIKSDEIFEKDNRNYFIFREKVIPIFTLAQILKFEKPIQDKEKFTVMVVKENETTVGIIIENLLNDQEILQRKLSEPLIKVKNISGITTLANGDSCLILNIDDLINDILNTEETAKFLPNANKLIDENNSQYKIMVIDDSYTTRILERNILKNAGYNVFDFANSNDAYKELKDNKYDLIIADYDMPDLTGLDIVKLVKNGKEKNYTTPFIVLTSYNEQVLRDELVKHGIERFIQKNNFNQVSFLKYVQFAIYKSKQIEKNSFQNAEKKDEEEL